MKEFRFRIILVSAVFLFSLYLLYPTYQDYLNNQKINDKLEYFRDSLKTVSAELSETDIEEILTFKRDSIEVSDESYKKTKEKRVKLGLDLQGGMYLVMEVNTAKLLEKLAKDPDKEFLALLKEAGEESKLSDENVITILASKLNDKNKRLNRYFGSIREAEEDIIARLEEQEKDAVTRAIEIIRNRVDQYGVSEPSIQKQGARRIIIELPGISKEEEAKQLLQGRALLEFKLLKSAEVAVPIMTRIDKILAGKTDSDTTSAEDSTSVKDMTEEQFAKEHPFFAVARPVQNSPYPDAFVAEQDKPKVENYLKRSEVQSILEDEVEFLFSHKPEVTQDGVNFYRLYLINKKAELEGGVIVDAQANIDPTTTAPIVTMQMNSEGSREWARITGSNINRRCAIVLDGKVYTAPVIRGKIPSGNSQIEGSESLEEAKLLEIVLKAGALPAPVDIIEERTVGPSLGQDSINQGFTSTIVGFLLVTIFMLIYYKKAGTIADLALFFTIVFIMGILAGFQATLTLPGIAGIILTIGMAVDANVIIYERIREELKTGKTVKTAVEAGYSHSYSAIFDSNITSFFTAIILYQFGSGPIQGFALTLMIGIVCSLFASLVLTRLLFDIMVHKNNKISFA